MATFVPSARFEGAREGHVFYLGDRGLGYYLDADQGQSVAGEVGTVHWKAFRDSHNQLYWAREDTNDSRWTKPNASANVVVDDFPEDEVLKNWRAYRAGVFNDELYFINLLTAERRWTRPPGYRGMPAGETEDHDLGPFVRYVDADTPVPYFYNPRTKLSTRKEPDPSLIISEAKAFPPISPPAAAASASVAAPSNRPTSSRSSSDSSSDGSSSSSSTSEDEGEGNDADPAGAAFDALLARKQVNHVSRWPNWAAKLQVEPEFAAYPADKRRARFEAFVRAQVVAHEQRRQKALEAAKEAMAQWAHSDNGKRVLSSGLMDAINSSMPESLTLALSKLEGAERSFILTQAVKASKMPR